jgi:hypothetical protein
VPVRPPLRHAPAIGGASPCVVRAGCRPTLSSFVPRRLGAQNPGRAIAGVAGLVTLLALAGCSDPLRPPGPSVSVERPALSVAASPGATQLDAGGGHSCAVKADGALACWGYNPSGQATAPAGVFTWVSAGPQHTCRPS